MFISAIVGLVIAISGGLSFMANTALPGDILYPVKTGVNEKVWSAFAVSDESQAQVDIALANRRLDEARRLSAEGRLSAQTSAGLNADINQYVAEVTEITAKLSSAADAAASAEISASLDTVLEAQEQILGGLNVISPSDVTGGNTDDSTPPPDEEQPEDEKSGPGVLQGRVSIGPNCPVEIMGLDGGVAPCPGGMEINLTNYAVVAYSKTQNNTSKVGTVVAQMKLDAEGNYRMRLPAGSYLVRVEPHVGMGAADNDFREVTLTAAAGATLNFDLDTGIR
ncbi:carboxypeptidase regulatory-like domain-containing protein [Candidatus Kaiserbacteria bacterium]|nr:carboxypeptidase regulatory-like domain-containing protein [Candidatus Kaiserbacteria bacterium]